MLHNKTVAFMARRIKAQHRATKISHLIASTTQNKIANTKYITESFKKYYAAFYDFRADPNTPQPSSA